MEPTKLNALDRFALAVSPSWGGNRIRARLVAQMLARHYEASSGGRRTTNWNKSATDANAANGPSLSSLRMSARDLVRNNAWARNGLRVIANNTVGWGISAKAVGQPQVGDLWKQWAETTDCDADGRSDFAGLQSLVVRTVAQDGEVLVRRRPRRAEDRLPIPLQLQVLEADFLDTARDGLVMENGNKIIQGIEFDKLGRRVAYWLFEQHPGSALLGAYQSKRIPAEDIAHVFFLERPGQVRGVSWYAPAIVNLRDFDEFEDATLMRQKIAACFAAFVTDIDGAGTAITEQDTTDPLVETIEPGLISYLKPGQNVVFATPAGTQDDGFSARNLRRIAAGLGITYEDMTGDYSQVNFSSARMSRIKHWGHVHDWRWLMLAPQLLNPVWKWAMDAAEIAGLVDVAPAVEWTPPPMPMLEPDREGLALQRLVRAGAMTPDEMVREQGYDPDTHWSEYAANLAALRAKGIVLDSDAGATTQAGLAQSSAAASKEPPSPPQS